MTIFMHKTRLLATAALIFAVQSLIHAQTDHWCGTDAATEQYFLEHPEARQAYLDDLGRFNQLANQRSARSEEKRIIPVVVHVLYDNCENNISMAQINDGLRIINEDFNRRNSDSSYTRSVFKSVAASSDIEFRLARIDPNGNPTNGVVRIETSATNNAQNNVKSISYWPSNQYLNIWVVESIYNFTGGGGTILGYAQFPGTGSWNTYGLVVRNDAFGTIGTSNSDGRTVTHEIGHCLNLYHTFQSGCGSNCSSSGDFVCDTPPESSASYDCSYSRNSCSNDATGNSAFDTNVPDMIENYMSYNSCQNLFTEGQAIRMKAALDNYSQLAILTSEQNLINTGVAGLLEADFYTNEDGVGCQYTPITFHNATQYDYDALQWDFASGQVSVANADDANPTVMFNTPGLHYITLKALYGNDSAVVTKPILITSSEGDYLPRNDDLEQYENLPNTSWIALNHDLDDVEWKLDTTVGFSGNKCFAIYNINNCSNRTDALITGSYDLSPFKKVTVSFKTAFARISTSNDYLRFYVSTDCGQSWQLNWVSGGSQLASAGTTTSWFVPQGPDDWKTHSIAINNSTYMTEGVMFKLEFVGQGGNNFYLDDFSLAGEYSGELLLRSPENGKTGLGTTVKIDWKSVGDADYYEYQVDVSDSFDTESLITGVNPFIDPAPVNSDTEAELSGLMWGTEYFWRVRYYADSAYSDWSDTWSFRVSDKGVGISESDNIGFAVFPNPATDLVQILAQTPIEQILITDIQGRIIHGQKALAPGAHELNVSEYKPGVYFVKAVTPDGKTITRKLIVN
ncbi:MAG: hypothetical protein Kow0075_06290 [Salibacteraceae bacterium]